ncbi:tail collar domain [Paraburkholderia unamae]|uniref:phage tail-collar fiber domain-containing protein n=1 Tax=Paraburkholderia unamae TaxID=219649 RepID=UPI000DC4E6A5|nr:phage tail protein [Paraburkholderia unamae]RAR53901.1 tail collar domain [Paraburkholderia unamae]
MANFRTIHTLYGLKRLAQSQTTGAAINIVAVSVGDGGGNPVTLDAEQTQLVRELFREKPNRVYQDAKNPAIYTVELVVPAKVGGFTIREMAAWDDQGGMFALANTPESYKPQGDGSEGSFSDTALRMQFMATDATVVTLQVDPNVTVATQDWITNTITVPYLLPGGVTGQVLRKKSNANGDTEWADPGVAEAVVAIVEEVQELADGQTAVILTECTTAGLSVYVGGSRLLPSQWTADAGDVTKLTLAAAYPAGTKADFVQNEPGAAKPLMQDRNLSDLQSAASARANLGVYSKEDTDAKAPPSLIAFFARTTAPSGWLKANGAAVSRTAYAALFAAIGTTFGTGDGFNTFNLPDMRGEFPRGWDDGRGADGGRSLGSQQAQSFASHAHPASADQQGSHAHSASTNQAGGHQHSGKTGQVGDHAHEQPNNGSVQSGTDNGGSPSPAVNGYAVSSKQPAATKAAGAHDHTFGTDTQGQHEHTVTVNAGGVHSHGVTVSAVGGTETRPRNVALLACIKF